MFDISAGAHTDVGDVRKVNQDSILSKTGLIGGYPVGLFIVADGCGGLAFGEEISKLAVTHFSRLWDTELRDLLAQGKKSEEIICDFLDETIAGINKRAVEFGKQVGDKVGTTFSLLLTVDNKYYIKNVGDSRVYLIRKKKISQLTEDQSLVASMVRNKELTQEEAKNFKKKNVLMMCIGLFDEVKTYMKTGRIENGDLFLLCSDGLYNDIPEDLFRTLPMQLFEKNLDIAAKSLRAMIPQGGARDNVSVVLAKFRKKAFWQR